MKQMLFRAMDTLEASVKIVVFGFYFVVCAVVIFQVLNRFWLHLPIIWTSDLAVICFIWLSLLTAARAVRQRGHFRMTLMLDLAGDSILRLILELLSILVGIVIFGLLAVEGCKMAVGGLHEISPGLQLPMIWAYLSVPVSAVFGLAFYLETLFQEVSDRNQAAYTGQPPDPSEAN